MQDAKDTGTRRLTTANINACFAAALADPARKQLLKRDWAGLLLSELSATPAERASLTSLPAQDARELQAAIARVVDQGGTIRMDRPSETGAGKLIVQPAGGTGQTDSGGEHADFSFGFFHCTFDAYFQHWHCGWGPG